MTKRALITGITGQDGSYLAELLLEKGYEVHGIKRRSSSLNTQRIDHIYQDPHEKNPKLKLHYGDLTDSSNLTRIMSEVQPDEVYNLGAQSHVAVSFEAPEYTADVDANGTLRLLEAIRFVGLAEKTRFYQASTSELYGLVQETPQTETTPFHPRSPYAVAKMYAYWITVNYREAYGMYACNGILFNHESPRRGSNFVTNKVVKGAVAIKKGLQNIIDGVEGDNAPAVKPGDVVMRIDPQYFRPAEVETLLGSPAKAKEKLGWVPQITTQEMCAEMVAADLKTARRHALLKEHGLDLPISLENG